MFFSQELEMMPNWFPWIFVGGIIFIALSFVGAKYKDKDYKKIQVLQDFISGSILIAFAGVLVPDMFPKFDLPEMGIVPISFSGAANDLDLQVGPPRLAGR